MSSCYSFLYFLLHLQLRKMYENVCFIISALLFAYAIRMLIFLHEAWKHYSKSIQISLRSPPVSTLKFVENSNEYSSTAIYHKSIAPKDHVTFSSLESDIQRRHFS